MTFIQRKNKDSFIAALDDTVPEATIFPFITQLLVVPEVLVPAKRRGTLEVEYEVAATSITSIKFGNPVRFAPNPKTLVMAISVAPQSYTTPAVGCVTIHSPIQ